MNDTSKVGIGCLIAGLTIYFYFGVNPGDLLNSPPIDNSINLEDSFNWIGGATSGALLISGTVILAVGLRSNNDYN